VSAQTWSTVANLATALGTPILAVATFSAIRSANLSARIAQRALLVGLQPVLMPSRREDATLKVNFGDRKWVQIPGSGAAAEVGGGDGTLGPDDSVIYLAVGQRVISKFTMLPRRDAESAWFASVSRHWNIDRPDPR
jgi:hypothetical protein